MLKQGVKAIILYEDSVLMLLRDSDVLNPDSWSLVGGEIELNENPATAIYREVMEEIGLAVNLIYIDTFYDKDDNVLRYIYLGIIHTNKVNLNEGQFYKFFKLNEFPKNNQSAIKILNRFIC